MKWTTKKPQFKEECLMIVASKILNKWEYFLFQVLKVDFEDGWYWGLFYGSEEAYGDIADLKADKYLVMPLLKNKK